MLGLNLDGLFIRFLAGARLQHPLAKEEEGRGQEVGEEKEEAPGCGVALGYTAGGEERKKKIWKMKGKERKTVSKKIRNMKYLSFVA